MARWLASGAAFLAGMFGSAALQAATAEQVLRGVLSEPPLATTFADARLLPGVRDRVAAVSEVRGTRAALTVYRPTSPSEGRLGEAYCHAALVQFERARLADEIDREVEDRRVADYLAGAMRVEVQMKELVGRAVPAADGWQAYLCRVEVENIAAPAPERPNAAAVVAARYAVAKQMYARGGGEEALDRFRRLRDQDETIYANALLFIVALLQRDHGEIAEALRRRAVRLELATDTDALLAYALAMKRAGLDAEYQASIGRCLALADDPAACAVR